MFLTKDYLWCATLAHKLARTTMAGVLGLAFACWGLSGCGEDDSVTESVTAEVEKVNEDYDGENIYFKIGDTIYGGKVLEGVSADEVKVRLDDRSEKVVSVDRIRGTLLADHSDIGVEVIMLGRQRGEARLFGIISGVYDLVNGTDAGRIKITRIRYSDGRREVLDVPRIYFIRVGTPLEKGGYLTREQFADLIRNGN